MTEETPRARSINRLRAKRLNAFSCPPTFARSVSRGARRARLINMRICTGPRIARLICLTFAYSRHICFEGVRPLGREKVVGGRGERFYPFRSFSANSNVL